MSSYLLFESSVVLDGTKTNNTIAQASGLFESSVVLDGTKTVLIDSGDDYLFESSVVLDGTKTSLPVTMTGERLRVVLF